VKRVVILIALLMLPVFGVSAWAYRYAEEFYKLYHEHLNHHPDDTMEDIYYLEHALNADLANPLWALAVVKTPTDWERYKYLFEMHLNLQMVSCYLTLGSKWDKQEALFFNAPWKQQNIDSYNIAESVYKKAYYYWTKAQEWSKKAWGLRSVHLEKAEEWEDESFRIETGDLDYKDTIDRTLAKLAEKRATFEKMDQNTY
jgi:hypothetical protein